jgi:hypothetical protein
MHDPRSLKDRLPEHPCSRGQERRQFVLTLRPEPGVDAIRSLRWGLKSLLRRHGLRCVAIMEVPPETQLEELDHHARSATSASTRSEHLR